MFDKKLVEKYLENLYLKKNISHTTMEAYEKDIFDFVSYMEEKNYNILNFSDENIKEYFIFLKTKYKISTLKRKYNSLKNFYKFLLKNKNTENNFSFKLELENNSLNLEKTKNLINNNFSLEDYNNFLNSLNNNLIFKIIIKLVVELNIKLSDVFEIQIKDLIKYNFKEIVIVKNNKISTYKTNIEIENLLKNYYENFAYEKRFLFGTYNRGKFYLDLKKNNLNLEMLKNSQKENMDKLEENIKKKYFEIGIGDK